MGKRSRTSLFAASFAAALATGSAAAAADGAAWRVSQGEVRITVPLRPGGAFEARTQSLGGTLTLAAAKPAQLAGELSVDLATIDTGIDLRNRHLRENYLEVAKGPGYARAVLTEIRLAEADGESFEGRSAFTGTLLLHNVSKAVAGSAEIRGEAGGTRVTATFPVLITDFAIETPQYMGVGVGTRLMVKVSLLAVRGAAR